MSKARGVKYTTILPEKIDKILENLSNKEGSSKADILRKAIFVYDKLYTELSDKKNKLFIIDEEDNSSTKELIIAGI